MPSHLHTPHLTKTHPPVPSRLHTPHTRHPPYAGSPAHQLPLPPSRSTFLREPFPDTTTARQSQEDFQGSHTAVLALPIISESESIFSSRRWAHGGPSLFPVPFVSPPPCHHPAQGTALSAEQNLSDCFWNHYMSSAISVMKSPTGLVNQRSLLILDNWGLNTHH